MTGKPTRALARSLSVRPDTTQETPFCLADASGYHLFSVREGASADTALAHSAEMLRIAQGLLLHASEMGDDDVHAAGLWLLDAATALVESVNQGGQPV